MHNRRYRINSGDSLSAIALSQLGSAKRWPAIYAYNNRAEVVAVTKHRIADPDKIVAGRFLLIPLPTGAHGQPSTAANRKHPRQTTLPRVAPQTAPAAAATPPATPSAAPAPGGGTTVNSFPFKYKLDLIPKQTVEGPNYTATLTFDGALTIWLDKQIPLGTVTNKGLEASAKQETDAVFAKLVQSQKISWEPNSRKATYENMLTINAHGAPPSLQSIGFAVTTDNPIPAMRFKFTSPLLQGKLGQHLYIAENFTVTVDLRPKGQDPDNTRQPEPVRVPVYAPAPAPEGFWQRSGHWIADHKVAIGVGAVVTAVVVSNFFTAGADAEVDPLVATWAARTLAASRMAAPVLAH